MKQYYYREGQTQHGPFSLKEIKAKNLTPETPVWYHPLTQWTTVSELKELQTAPAKASDKKYHYKDGDGQHGPFSLNELTGKNISAATQVWYHPLPQWTTADKVDEFKSLIGQASTKTAIKEEVKPAAQPVKQAVDNSSEKKYYYRAGTTQYGPLSLDDLKGKGILTSTQVWYHPLAKWTTAGKVDELKSIIESTPAQEEVKQEVKPASKITASNGSEKKYYYREGTTQYGPLALEDLRGKGLTATTQVWYHPLPQWTTAGKVDELKGLLGITSTEIKEEIKPVTPSPVAQTVAEPKEGVKAVVQPAQIVSSPAAAEEKKPETQVISTSIADRKYYYHDGVKQNGPFAFGELKGKNIKPEMLVWYDPMPEWLPAGQLEELKGIVVSPQPVIKAAPAPVVEVKEPVKAATPVVVSAPVTTVAAATPVARPARRNTAWVSWIFSILVLGGVGYLVYTDMNKDNSKISGAQTTDLAVDDSNNGAKNNDGLTDNKSSNPSNGGPVDPGDDQGYDKTVSTNSNGNKNVEKTTTTSKPVTTKTTATTTRPVNTNTKTNDKKPEATNTDKNAIYRNQWPNFISFGKLDYKSGALSGIKAFDVPVINRTGFTLDQVTIRLDYIKKGGGVFKTETLTVSNVPPNSTSSAKAPASNRGTSVNAYITGISSSKLNFCYPLNNGNPADPYYCK
jgi:hypothetical protein